MHSAIMANPPSASVPTKFQLFRQVFPQVGFVSFVSEMRKALEGCETCLDIGCGVHSPARFVPFRQYVGLDGYAPAIEEARQKYPNREFILGSAQDLDKLFKPDQFDCVVALDLIEHLPKEDGYRFIECMSRIARKKVLLFTPNGFLPQQSHDGDLQEHLSGWDAAEMKAMGFKVVGMHGPKKLRGEYHSHKIKPAALGGIVCQLCHWAWTRNHPEKAAAIMCVKDVSSSKSGS